MKNLAHQILEALETQSKTEIPIDLLIDIFSRVPAKTIATLRCISKLWGSILCRMDFKELFLTMSLTRPRLLLFTVRVEEKLCFFSSPQAQNLHEDSSSLLTTPYHALHMHSPESTITKMGSPNHGFICRQDHGSSLDAIVICNPVTGESISLPKVEPKIINTHTAPYLGYDPVDKQFKVLCIYPEKFPNTSYEHQISTLENGVRLWRPIQCKPHYPISSGLCIDGVLYYTAGVDGYLRVLMIVCFDVRSEKFNFIDIDECMLLTTCILINFKGRLGALQFGALQLGTLQFTLLSPRCRELWVLEYDWKYKWSKDFYTLPPLCNNLVGHTDLVIVGVTGRDEVVLLPLCIMDPFYIYYYNHVSNSFTRVQIQGLEVFKRKRVYTFLNYDENLKLM